MLFIYVAHFSEIHTRIAINLSNNALSYMLATRSSERVNDGFTDMYPSSFLTPTAMVPLITEGVVEITNYRAM